MNMQENLITWPDNIYAVDSGFVRPGLAAVHLIVEKGRVAVVDTAHNDSLPRFLAALAELGLSPEAVDYVFLTHVHLDHAGGSGAYMACLPNARLVVHPDGARHMIDPSRLYASTLAVYGPEKTHYLYGELITVPADRVIEASDGQVFSLAGRLLQCLYTPGHARHHLCLWDERARACFTGDTFGIAYRELYVNGEPFLIPATTPTQFDPEVLKDSIRRLLALQPKVMYLTHFSRVDNVERLGGQLLRRIDDFVALAEAAPGTGEDRKEAIHEAIERYMLAEAFAMSGEGVASVLSEDMELNAQGLSMWVERRLADNGAKR